MEKDLLILENDKNYARQRIAELDAQIIALGPEFYDVFNQTSETWHDNAPFEVLRDRQALMAAERDNLKSILRNCLPSIPKQKRGVVGIGTKVTARNKTNDKVMTYFIAGDWTANAGQVVDEAIIVSRRSPIALKLIGKKCNDEILHNDLLVIESLDQ